MSKQDEFTLFAAALQNRERIQTLMEYDFDDIFYEIDSKIIHDAIRQMVSDGTDPDLSALAVRLKDTNPERADDIILELSRAPISINFTGLMFELKRIRQRSHIQKCALDICDIIKTGGTKEEVTDIITDLLDNLNSPDRDTHISIKDLAEQPLDDIFKHHQPMPTGIPAIDNSTPGLYGGQLVVIAARPGLGKSSLAFQIAGNMPETSLFFSLEMSRQELFARGLSSLADVESWKIEMNKITDVEAHRVLNAQDVMRHAESNLIIIDRLSDISRILNTARRFARRGNVSTVFIDYLQLISGGRGENQNLRIADITRRLKQFAMEAQVPVVLLSQLNRNTEYRDREPVLSDLRDSGAIEQDADLVVFINENDDGTSLIFAKNRKGRTGKTPIDFEKRFTRFN